MLSGTTARHTAQDTLSSPWTERQVAGLCPGHSETGANVSCLHGCAGLRGAVQVSWTEMSAGLTDDQGLSGGADLGQGKGLTALRRHSRANGVRVARHA